MRAVVVGAGLAGLSAAMRLRRRGFDVLILERSRLLGGKATSFTVDGVEVDNGQHVHLACCTEYLGFVAGAGMAGALWTQPRFAVTVLARGMRPSRLHAAPGLPPSVALLPSFVAYRPVGLAGKWRLARALRDLDEVPDPAETFDRWLRRHHQTEDAVGGFWSLFVVPALNAGLDEVSATDALFVLRTAFGDIDGARIGWSRVPLARIAEAAAGAAGEVRMRTAVTGLLDDGERVHGVRCADGAEVAADAVVLAVPPSRLRAILGEATGYGVHGLDAFSSRAIVDVHLWFDAGHLGVDFAAIIDSPVQWVFEKSPGYLCCSMSAADSLVRSPETDLVELCRTELAAVWPALTSARLRRGAVTRDPDATFVPVPGLRRPPSRTARPNLAIAGAWTDTGWPATMESAVRSGRHAADAIATAASAARLPEPSHA